MKLTKTDYILIVNNLVLISILGYLYYKLEYESGIFIKNNILINTCKYVNNRNNPNYLFSGKSLYLPSINQIKGLIIKKNKKIINDESLNSSRSSQIYFFGG